MRSLRNKGKIGLVMLAAWFVSRFSLYTLTSEWSILERAILFDDSFYLIMAAALVATSNAIKAILLYCGCFLAAEAASEKTGREFIAWVVPPLIITVSYQATAFFHLPSVPQFGFAAFFTFLSVLFLQYICRRVTRGGYKILIQSMFILAIHWLDVIPSLTRWGLGMGELSLTVKTLANLMGKEDMLGTVCLIFFMFNAIVALLMVRLFISYEKQLLQLNLIRSRERDLIRLRNEQAHARLYQELQLLVHDLKRPLTVIIGLANLLSQLRGETGAAHNDVILEAAEGMNQMIDEIKSPAAMRCVCAGELLNYVMSQVRPLPWGTRVLVEADEAVCAATIKVNLIRFSRAIVNLLDNANRASEFVGGDGLIKFSARRTTANVIIDIEDDGPGFVPGKQGVSLWGSSGLGLVFVRQTMEDGNCQISYTNRLGGGTQCTVTVPLSGEGGM